MKSYNETKIPKFDISPLDRKLVNIEEREEFLKNFISYLYGQPTSNLTINLKLMEEIARKHHEISVNIFFLQAYQRTFNTHEKLGL